MLDLYDRKFKKLAQNKVHIVKSLGYFEDAEPETMPKMIKEVSWEAVKKFFLQEQKILARQLMYTRCLFFLQTAPSIEKISSLVNLTSKTMATRNNNLRERERFVKFYES